MSSLCSSLSVGLLLWWALLHCSVLRSESWHPTPALEPELTLNHSCPPPRLFSCQRLRCQLESESNKDIIWWLIPWSNHQATSKLLRNYISNHRNYWGWIPQHITHPGKQWHLPHHVSKGTGTVARTPSSLGKGKIQQQWGTLQRRQNAPKAPTCWQPTLVQVLLGRKEKPPWTIKGTWSVTGHEGAWLTAGAKGYAQC